MSDKEQDLSQEAEETIDHSLEQMEMLYRSRCCCMPGKSNVTIREIPSEPEKE